MIRYARVVAVHPRRQAVDVVFTDNGARALNVSVMSGNISSDSGSWRVPNVPRPATEDGASAIDGSSRNLLAVVDVNDCQAVVLGFVRHQHVTWLPTEQNRWLDRHPSGTYTTVAPDGSVEIFHASGAYLRIGTGEHADVPGAPASPGAPAPTVTCSANGATFKIDTSGNISATTSGAVTVSGEKGVAIESGANLTLSAAGNLVLKSKNLNMTDDGSGTTTLTSTVPLGIKAPTIDLTSNS